MSLNKYVSLFLIINFAMLAGCANNMKRSNSSRTYQAYIKQQQRDAKIASKRVVEERRTLQKKEDEVFSRATRGDPEYQYELAMKYGPLLREEWLIKAAKQGHAKSQYELGILLLNKTPLTMANISEAESLLKKVSVHEYKDSKIQLRVAEQLRYALLNPMVITKSKESAEELRKTGANYYFGFEVKQDYYAAMKHYKLASEGGDADSLNMLGLAYEEGNGATFNLDSASKMFAYSTIAGSPAAMKNLERIEEYKRLHENALKGNSNDVAVWGNRLYEKKNFTEAVKWLEICATAGNADCQYKVGHIYQLGLAGEQDRSIGKEWLEKAVQQNHLQATLELNSIIIADFDNNALMEIKNAANHGDAEAQTQLGNAYANGENIPQDDVKAVMWYRKAADKKFARAQNNLAVMYAQGRGVVKDPEEAAKWYYKAAVQGDKYAQFNLGEQYLLGIGVGKNILEAEKWFKQAASQGHENAKKKLESMQNIIQRAQIATNNNTSKFFAQFQYSDCAKYDSSARSSWIPNDREICEAHYDAGGQSIVNLKIINCQNDQKVTSPSGDKLNGARCDLELETQKTEMQAIAFEMTKVVAGVLGQPNYNPNLVKSVLYAFDPAAGKWISERHLNREKYAEQERNLAEISDKNEVDRKFNQWECDNRGQFFRPQNCDKPWLR